MKYPLYEHTREDLKLPSERPLTDLSLESLQGGGITSEDLGIHETTLQKQSQIAKEEGFSQVAENLSRAAELTRIPDDKLLEIYEALRPGRSSQGDLEKLASEVEKTYDAPLNATFIREAA
ncbi:MAG TPA: diol dehydratase small subunit, partial [Acidobacteriota bacterium]|nr:diol dehydratase small subunit [Acidobacteriota bacterium]